MIVLMGLAGSGKKYTRTEISRSDWKGLAIGWTDFARNW